MRTPSSVSWRTLVCLAAAALLIGPFLWQAHTRVASPGYFRLLTSPKSMVWLHLVASGLALVVGWLSLVQGTTRQARPRLLHRWLGRIYCAGVAGGIAGGAALLPHLQFGGWPARIGMVFGLVLWTGFTASMLVTAWRGQIDRHRRWAMRSYAISFAGITLRFILETGLAWEVPRDLLYATAACSCFLINFLVVEFFFVRRLPASGL